MGLTPFANLVCSSTWRSRGRGLIWLYHYEQLSEMLTPNLLRAYQRNLSRVCSHIILELEAMKILEIVRFFRFRFLVTVTFSFVDHLVLLLISQLSNVKI